MLNEESLSKELSKYNIADAAIAELSAKYMGIKVSNPQDIENYKLARVARVEIKNRRVEVEKTRKELKADSLEYGRKVDAEAKRITALLEPIETYLTSQEKIVEDEKERIRLAEAQKKDDETRRRLKVLSEYLVQVLPQDIADMPEEQFNVMYNSAREKFAVAEKIKRDEEDRLKAAAEAQRIEAERLKEIEAKQFLEMEKIRHERERVVQERIRLEEEAKRAEDKKRHDAEIEEQKIRHAREMEEYKKKEEERVKLEAERLERERIAAEKQAKEEEERKAALLPDKDRLIEYRKKIADIRFPEMNTVVGKGLMLRILVIINETFDKAMKEF